MDLDGIGELNHWCGHRTKGVEVALARRADMADWTQTTEADWAAALDVADVATWDMLGRIALKCADDLKIPKK